MALFEGICRYLQIIGQFTRRFRMAQYVVHHICNTEDTRLAELVVARVIGSYASTGGGFNRTPAGISNDSADAWSQSQWRSAREWQLLNTPLLTNFEADTKHLDGYLERVRVLKATSEKLMVSIVDKDRMIREAQKQHLMEGAGVFLTRAERAVNLWRAFLFHDPTVFDRVRASKGQLTAERLAAKEAAATTGGQVEHAQGEGQETAGEEIGGGEVK